MLNQIKLSQIPNRNKMSNSDIKKFMSEKKYTILRNDLSNPEKDYFAEELYERLHPDDNFTLWDIIKNNK